MANLGMLLGVGAAAVAAGPSFSDNFNRSDRALGGDNGWTVTTAGNTSHDIVSNELAAVASAGGETVITQGGVSFADGYVQVDAKVSSINIFPAVMFRKQDESNMLICIFSYNSSNQNFNFEFYKKIAGSFSSLGTGATANSTWNTNTYGTIKVEFVGSALKVYFNGAQVGSTITDSSILAAGTTGFRNDASGAGTTTFDNYSAVSN